MQLNSKGVLYVPCKDAGITDPILRQSLTTQAAPGLTTVGGLGGFTIPTNKGDVLAIDVSIGSTTIADLNQLFITILANGLQIFNGQNALAYSSLFQNDRREILITIPGGAVITGSITNGSAATIPVFIDFLFYNPYGS